MKITSLFQLFLLGAILSLVSCSSQGVDETPQSPVIHPSLALLYADSLKGDILLPDSTYRFALSASENYKSVSLAFSLIRQDGTSVLVNEYFTNQCTFRYNTSKLVGENWWRCGKDSAYIRLKVTANAQADGYPYLQQSMNLKIPFRPEKPVITLIDTLIDDQQLQLSFKYNCCGATNYRLIYQAYGDSIFETIGFSVLADSTLTVRELHPGKRYAFQLVAFNAFGQSVSNELVYHKIIPSGISLSVNYDNRKIKYRLVMGTEEVSDVEVRSIRIFDEGGRFKKEVKTAANEFFALDDLENGTYVLKVELANYQIYTRVFSLM